MLYELLKKIIRTGVGKGRMITASVGLTIAILLILSAVQIQANFDELLHGKNNRDSIANFLVINKAINGNRSDNSLTAEDLSKLKRQPFVEAVGQLTASRFKVSAQSPSDRFPFYTDLFFESVPDEFIDVKSADWAWQTGSTSIPLIIPNQFLDMYNFGFAPSQNLTQLTPAMVMALPIAINVSYNGQPIRFTGHVVGFSDRISSVLVPDNFLKLANQQFGNNAETKPSRVIIKTNDPGNPELVKYLKDNGLVTDADKTRFSQYRRIVNTIVGASWATGVIMLVFALLIFSLFIQLTIASTKDEITLLITLGIAPSQLQKFLLKQFLPAGIIITAISLIALAVGQYLLRQYLASQNMFVSAALSFYTGATALLILIVLFLVNTRTIKRYIAGER